MSALSEADSDGRRALETDNPKRFLEYLKVAACEGGHWELVQLNEVLFECILVSFLSWGCEHANVSKMVTAY